MSRAQTRHIQVYIDAKDVTNESFQKPVGLSRRKTTINIR
jgi:hypothetical protein